MLTFLQLSDIHFRKSPEELDEYSQMRVRMNETIEDYCKNETIDAILICGDLAFSGCQTEYEDKAKVFIDGLMSRTGCNIGQVYMVPGNHDKNRSAKDGSMRSLLRDGMLYGSNGDELFSKICQEESHTFKRMLTPFEEYIKYASRHRCVSAAALKTFLGQSVSMNDKLYWQGEIGMIGNYRVVLYGINSCLVSDWEDRDNPHDESKGHLQYLSKQMYNINKHRDEINISMMHHPLDFIKDGETVGNRIDGKFAVQFYGHIHQPSVKKGEALKIFSGALQPPIKDVKANDDYYPVFNIIQMDVVNNDYLQVDIIPYTWRWTGDEDGVFDKGEKECYQINIKDDTSTRHPQRGRLKLPENETARSLEIRLMTKPHGENIIKKMYPDFVLKHEPIADYEAFFMLLRRDDRYIDLYNHLR